METEEATSQNPIRFNFFYLHYCLIQVEGRRKRKARSESNEATTAPKKLTKPKKLAKPSSAADKGERESGVLTQAAEAGSGTAVRNISTQDGHAISAASLLDHRPLPTPTKKGIRAVAPSSPDHQPGSNSNLPCGQQTINTGETASAFPRCSTFSGGGGHPQPQVHSGSIFWIYCGVISFSESQPVF